ARRRNRRAARRQSRVEQSLKQACTRFGVYSRRKKLNGEVPFAGLKRNFQVMPGAKGGDYV
ncbi:MAG TPA: hypothetical protein VIM38_00100, partial [Alphaproteobacteria bacterium]